MRRHILDALIIGIAVGLGASSLYAQGFRNRNAMHTDQPIAMTGSARRPSAITGSTRGTAPPVPHAGSGSVSLASAAAAYRGQTTYEKNSGLAHTTTCANAAGAVVPCRK